MIFDGLHELDAPALQLRDGLLDVVAIERHLCSARRRPLPDSVGWTPSSAAGGSKIIQPSPMSVPDRPSLSFKRVRSAAASEE